MKTEKSAEDKSVNIDAWLAFIGGFGPAAMAILSTDEAYHYCNAYLLFWMKFTIAAGGAGLGSVKAFRSTSFGKRLLEKEAERKNGSPLVQQAAQVAAAGGSVTEFLAKTTTIEPPPPEKKP